MLQVNCQIKNDRLKKLNMKRILGGVIIFSSLCFQSSRGKETQVVLEDFKLSSINQKGKQYPQVNSQRRVHARILAPQANRVQHDIGGTKYLLKLPMSGLLGADA
jgi:enterochelin esterase family protein